jgi:5-(carboxyamino)imidazole ribonucleotide synthase
MVFNPALNLLDFQISPAEVEKDTLLKAEALALKVVKELHSPGIFAVEMFVDDNNEVWVNETAPRVHNSGHHTIEGNYCSQFDMLWRVILGYPLGNPKPILQSAIINLLGAQGYFGTAVYEGLSDVLKLDNVFVHLYGKQQTKPGRKMGHVTVLANEPQELIHKAAEVKKLLKVVSR